MTSKLNTIILETGGTCCTSIDSKTVFSDEDVHFYLSPEHKQKYIESEQVVNLFSCENANFEELNINSFNNSLGL